MLISNIRGGLGNQFFMYAFGRALSLKYDLPLYLDVSCFKGDRFQRTYSLGHFRVKGKVITGSSIFQTCRFLAKCPSLLRRKPFSRFKIFFEPKGQHCFYDDTIVQPSSFNSISFCYLFGYWQNELYFRDFHDDIRNDFTISAQLGPQVLEIASAIESVNAVCIHCRRLWALPPQNIAQPASVGDSLPLEYYKKAITAMTASVPKPHFFCFSDQPEWLASHLQIDHPITFVDHRGHSGKDYEDLWLMSLCKYFIIANSTFSWWAAWLSKFHGKIVLCPDPAQYLGAAMPAQGWQIIR